MKIYVGNFSFSMTEPELRSMFEPFGTVESASLITDRDTGRSRGFGFVEMPDSAQANAAMTALNGKEVDGRALAVNEARQKTERGPSNRGSGGGRRDSGGRGRDRRW